MSREFAREAWAFSLADVARWADPDPNALGRRSLDEALAELAELGEETDREH